MPELDWIVEQEDLPPDEPYHPAPDDEPPRPRRIPAWAWIVGGLLLGATVVLVVLWNLGGRDEPLPPSEPALDSLRAAVELELDALNRGDREIYDRQQDGVSRRRNHQPPPDTWFAPGRPAGSVELLDLQSLGPDAARADVRLDWQGMAYRLVYFYRQQGDRWLHTDWAPGRPTEPLSLTTPHLLVQYEPEEEREAVVLARRTEELITGLCGLLPCPSEAFSLTLGFDRLYAGPGVDENGDHFGIPSPLRIRWPLDGEPEPLVMGSLARHLARRLIIPPASAGLDDEGRDALSLIAFWLAHDLLDLEPLPGTTWLAEVEAHQGLPGVVALAEAIRAGVPPQQAVRERLNPATVAAVTRRPDYLTWISLTTDAFRLLQGFDDAADPWAPAGGTYRRTGFQLVEVVFRGEWAIGLRESQSNIVNPVLFRLTDGNWRVTYSPDESLIGREKTRVAGPFSITYREWDEPYLDPVIDVLTRTHERVVANFGLPAKEDYPVLIIPYPNYTVGWSEIAVQWPALNAWAGRPAVSDETLVAIVGSVMSAYLDLNTLPEDRVFMVIGLFLWQLEDLGIEPDRWYDLIGFDEMEDWHPPADVDDPAWLPLDELWQTPPSEFTPDITAQYLWTPYMLTKYIVATYGVDRVRAIADELRAAESIDAWITAVTGDPIDEFEPAWRRWVIANWQTL